MAWREFQYRLISDCPLLMHNGQTSDPLNKFSKAMKAISGKRKKTEADHEEMARIEFLSGLYMGKAGPVLPATMIDACIVNASKKSREGPLAKAGFFTKAAAPLEYDGPRMAEELWADERFRHTARVRIQTSSVMRTRPIFSDWSAIVTVALEVDLVNVSQLDAWFNVAGTQIGLGDWRPQHGRFTAVRLSE
jgi:hypothetical protein